MRNLGRYLVVLLIVALSNSVSAQDEAIIDSLNLSQQFDYVYKKSNTFEQFKVVRMRHLNSLKKNSTDSIKKLKSTINTNEAEIRNLKVDQDALQKQIVDLQTQLEGVTKSKNSMLFLGQEISKSVYNTILWGLIFGLAALAAIAVTLFKRSNSITKETKERLSEVEEDFEKHRKSALKREQKLARELMDYKVKNKL
jgi:hypothetical protein